MNAVPSSVEIPSLAIPSNASSSFSAAPRAVVVIGPGQVVTSVVLRSLGWEVILATSPETARQVARKHHAQLVFVRVSSSYLRSMRCPPLQDTTVVAIVDSDEDGPLPGFDATIAIENVDELAAFVRSSAPTARYLKAAADGTDDAISCPHGASDAG